MEPSGKVKEPRFTAKQEFKAEIRNKLTMPLAILNEYKKGKELSNKDIRLAINELKELLRLIEKNI